VRRELELAAEIQRNLLPAPRPAPFPVFGVNVPARTVSGDFFDILPLSHQRIAFCLGDVAGKGMNASLLMAKTASLYRCLAREQASPGALLARLNDEICETATRGMFVTMAAGLYDAATGAVRIANAGHEPPLLHAGDGGFEEVPAQAPPLGILAGVAFPEADLELAGGSLYLCSDGLTEASCGGGPLGGEGLRRLIARQAGKPLAERIQAIVAEVAGCELRDDLTLLGVSDAGRGA
jgi:sigma-B regulation protein RsbU (phosphoserine phosphatase)